MKKTFFKVWQHKNGTLADQLTVLCCKNNAADKNLTLADIQAIVKANQIQYPGLYGDTIGEVGEDRFFYLKEKSGENYKLILTIEQVEILELKTESEHE